MKEATIPTIVKDDPWLEPYTEDIKGRINRYQEALEDIKNSHGSLKKFASAYKTMGIHFDQKKNKWVYKEWAPGAEQLYLIGDFNGWDRKSHPLKKKKDGIWEITLPAETLNHKDLVKVHVVFKYGASDRIPAYIQRAVQDENTKDFKGQVWEPGAPFEWTDQDFKLKNIAQEPLIYEAHIGIATEEERIGSYKEFTREILPRIHKLGYNVIQLMAIQEHPYYGSFGYHVSNFFSPSSRFGTPEDLKFLINKAHELGMAVIIDLVHSHAVKNTAEGLNKFDGTDDQYFHPGARGEHTSWDSKLFNYGKPEVKQFLLSNVAYWIEEFHVDGFRFDGVTSMLYFHHGDYVSFSHYDQYFKESVEWDAVTYLQLANDLAHSLKKDAITIAEDMSGMPGLCRQQDEGGIGFDFRLGMGIPDFWIKNLKEKRDEHWDIYEMWNMMVDRRYKEGTIAYAESHDQAYVGDKTIAFWLMDKEMYWHMSVNDESYIIDRGIALHKLIRFFTLTLGGEGYLNFIGNEFGHPEWIDFPREGNGWSFKYAKRQWSLVKNKNLKFQYLESFDKAMLEVIKKYKVLTSPQAVQINMDPENKVIIFERANLIFLFNFHPLYSIPNYEFYAPAKGNYKVILSSDDEQFGGEGRVDTQMTYPVNESQRLSVYLTHRTAIVMKKS